MEVWKERSIWIGVLAGLLLLFILSFFYGGRGGAELSFAATLISIILAVVAIIYSIVQGNDSQRNMGEMRGLMSEASRLISAKADEVAGSAKSLTDLMTDLSRFRRGPGEAPGQERTCLTTQMSLDLSRLSDLSVVALYALVKSKECDKPVDVSELGRIVNPVPQEYKQSFISFAFLGISQVCWAFWGHDAFETRDITTVAVKQLPDGFGECIHAEVKARSGDPAMKQDVNKVNDYFASVDT